MTASDTAWLVILLCPADLVEMNDLPSGIKVCEAISASSKRENFDSFGNSRFWLWWIVKQCDVPY